MLEPSDPTVRLNLLRSAASAVVVCDRGTTAVWLPVPVLAAWPLGGAGYVKFLPARRADSDRL